MLCEGDSEELAVKWFLRRQLEEAGLKGVSLHPINLAAKLEDIFVKTRLFQHEPGVVAVFTLIDLYGMNRVRHAPDTTLDEQVATVRYWQRQGIPDVPGSFFHAHVCVHDIEAWFLAEGQALAKRLKYRSLSPCPHAESLNLVDPPKSRVNQLFRTHLHRSYHETSDGTPLFKDLSHTPIYETCRYYRELYDDLLAVAKTALTN